MTVRIVSGPRDGGKTSWCRNNIDRKATSGVLLAKVLHDGRITGYDAEHFGGRDTVPFLRRRERAPDPWDEADRIGPYSLSGAGLSAARRWLSDALLDSARDVLIDEVGRLELAGRGFEPQVREALLLSRRGILWLVVRDEFVRDVAHSFGMRGRSDLSLFDVAGDRWVVPPPF